MRPSVLIADDYQLFAEGLRSLLTASYEISGIASNATELTEMATRYKPDLILTDVSTPLLNGLDVIQTLTQKGLRSKYVIVTMHRDVNLAVRIFRAGASALVLKTASREELMEALEVVQHGGCYLSTQFPCDLVTLLSEVARRPTSSGGAQLTRRQCEVLQLVAEGKTNKEIATQLSISTRTAESYKYHLMNVLGLHTSAELVQYAIKIGLIIIDPLDSGE